MKSNAKREIVYVSTERLRPFEANPRKNDDAVPKVVESIKTFGFLNPIIVDKNYRICAGHTRYKAALAMGLTEVPIIIVPDLIGKKFEAFNVADNKTGEIADWDDDKLGAIIKDLDDSGFDTTILGYTDGEISAILKRIENKLAGADPDDVPEAPKKAITKPGDLWILGEHRLLCGDATNAEEVAKLTGGQRIDCLFTDPPYAIYGSSTGIAADITDDKMVRPFFRDVVLLAVATLKQFGHAYICCDWRSWASWWEVSKGTGLLPKNMIVWDKGGGLGGMFGNCHELLMFASNRPLRQGMSQKIAGERTVAGPNVWRIVRAGSQEGEGERKHNAQKPVELVIKALEYSSDSEQSVIDPFVGSGTTIIAAERTARRCFAMDIDPIYCDVAVKRWETFTGKKAVLDK